MFARQVDPLAPFTSTISASEAHLRPDQDCHRILRQNLPFASSPSLSSSYSSTSRSNSDCSHSNKPNNGYNPYKRKHPLQFEPDFFEALDASLQDFHEDTAQHNDANGCWKGSLSSLNGSPPWSARPGKRVKSSLCKGPASQSTGATSPTPPPLSPRSSHSPNKTTTTSQSDNRNKETDPDPASHRKTPLVFPQASPSTASAWSHRNVISNHPAFARNPKGPSIIDLSSGEELVAIYADDMEQHKRRRSSSCEPLSLPESGDSMHQVFELQADGSLLPILDPEATDPSPSKRMRLNKTNRCSYLHFLSDDENEIERLSTKRRADMRRRKAHNGFIGPNGIQQPTSLERVARGGAPAPTSYREEPSFGLSGSWTGHSMDAAVGDSSQNQGSLSDQANQQQPEEPGAKREPPSSVSNHSRLQTMVLYKRPKDVSLTPHHRVYEWNHRMDDKTSLFVGLDGLRGHEMVLYEREPDPQDSSSKRNVIWGEDNLQEDDLASSVVIEELSDDDDDDDDDDDGNLADDEAYELPIPEEQIADMDID